IALMHHGFEWLAPQELPNVRSLLVRRADLVLCGHDHREEILTQSWNGYSCILHTGADAGGPETKYHRGILGTIDTDGAVYFQRLLYDRERGGNDDEWNHIASVVPNQIKRVDESMMRS